MLITPQVANNVGQARMVSDELRKKMKRTEELLDCGTSNALGYTTRGGLWCQDRQSADPNINKPLDK